MCDAYYTSINEMKSKVASTNTACAVNEWL